MRYPRIIAAIRSEVWMITPTAFQAIADVLSARLTSNAATAPAKAFGDRPPSSGRMKPDPGGQIAVVPVWGIIGKRLDAVETMCGGCDLESVDRALTDAHNDSAVSDIILHFDTPGGISTGVPELAAKIRRFDQDKPIYAFTDTLMASAGYWLAAACRGVFATGSSQTGSIGAYIALVNEAKNWELDGFQLELMKSGQFKAMGIAGKPFEDHERAFLQGRVDRSFDQFKMAIRLRREVADDAMQGQTFDGHQAEEAGLIDEVVQDLEAVIESIELERIAAQE